MKKQRTILLCLLACTIAFAGCNAPQKAPLKEENPFLQKATQTLDSLYAHYAAENTCLLRENYPPAGDYAASYLASEEQKRLPNPYSYLWPYSGTFSAVCALLETTGEQCYRDTLEKRVLPGLESYHDSRRKPEAYASYINTAPQSDRFYDDNIWLGIDFTDLYRLTKEEKYLQQARKIWTFIESGMDNTLGGGIYWCEQKKQSKNTCSNAPGSVLALKLFRATGDSSYLEKGRFLYEWTKATLQDSTDCLYFDNISTEGEVCKAKYAYNSGQMMQASAMLYKLTGEASYLKDAQAIAQSCHLYFFTNHPAAQGGTFRLIKKGDVWFTAVMLRGFIELYQADGNRQYLHSFEQSLDYAWTHAREENGLFNTDFSGENKDDRKWLLTQAAMVEMYARLAACRQKDK